jgi:hypothetical protein
LCGNPALLLLAFLNFLGDPKLFFFFFALFWDERKSSLERDYYYTRGTRARTRAHLSNHAVVVARSPRVSSSLRASGGRTSDGREIDDVDIDDDDAEDRRRFVFASVFIVVG